MSRPATSRAGTPPARGSRAGAPAAPAKPAANPFLLRGKAALDGAEQEATKQAERAEQRKNGVGFLSRFGVRKGETREIVILDESLEDGVALYEHQYEENGSWNHYEQCLREATGDGCPICKALNKQGGYVNYLTILDLTGYTKRNGEVVPQSRSLLGIKGAAALDRFKQLQNIARSQGKSLRGMFLRMHRAEGAENSARIGEPMMLTEMGGAPFFIYSEEELEKEFGSDAIIGRDGKTVVKEANADLYPYPYDLAFPMPNIPNVYKRWGIPLPMGMQADSELADEDAGEGEAEAETPTPPVSRRQLPASAAAPAATRAAPARAAAAPARAAAPSRTLPATAAPATRAAPARAAASAGRAAPARAAAPSRTPSRAPSRAAAHDDPDAGDGAGGGYEDGEDPLR